MSFFVSLSASIREELSAGRVGRPVSVRAYLEISSDHGHLRDALAQLGGAAMDWMGDTPRRVMVQGAAPADHLCALFEGTDGATALITTSVQRRPAPLVDLLILGDRGTIRFNSTADERSVDFTMEETSSLSRDQILRAIEDSLQQRAPVELAPPKEKN